VSGARRGAVVWVVWIVWLFGVADRKIIVDGDATGAFNQARKDPLACETASAAQAPASSFT
jgi:hypothetical protein